MFFDKDVSDEIRVTFIRFIHEHLLKHAQDVVRDRFYYCTRCGRPIENKKAIQARVAANKKTITCQFCDKKIILFDLIEEKFADDVFLHKVQKLDMKAGINLDNESRELILIGHAFAVVGEAGQIFRPTPNSDWGIDGEIEFKDYRGQASGKRVYLQLKSGDSCTYSRSSDGEEIFYVKNERHLDYWQKHAYPVYLVVRHSNGEIRWMNVTKYLADSTNSKGTERRIRFQGEAFNASSVIELRDRFVQI